MHLRDRIVELRRIKASELLPNGKNWRQHPTRQADALRGILADIGFADAAIAVERPEGLVLLDGHLRAEVAGDAIVPVLIVDLNEAEASKLLTCLDPLAAMAEADAEKLESLLSEISTSSDSLQAMLDELAADNGIRPPTFEPVAADEQGRLDRKKLVQCPHCGETFEA